MTIQGFVHALIGSLMKEINNWEQQTMSYVMVIDKIIESNNDLVYLLKLDCMKNTVD